MDCSPPGSSVLGFWSGLPFPSPGDLPDPEIEPGSPALQAGSLLSGGENRRIIQSSVTGGVRKEAYKPSRCWGRNGEGPGVCDSGLFHTHILRTRAYKSGEHPALDSRVTIQGPVVLPESEWEALPKGGVCWFSQGALPWGGSHRGIPTDRSLTCFTSPSASWPSSVYDFIAAVQADAGPLEALRAGFFLSAALVGLGVEMKIMSSADRGRCFIFQEVSASSFRKSPTFSWVRAPGGAEGWFWCPFSCSSWPEVLQKTQGG